MAKTTTKPQQQATSTQPPEILPAKLPEPKANLAMSRMGLQISNLEQAYRFAQCLADSTVVPDAYKKKPSDCLVALDLAGRLGVSWMAIMQNVYPVHGRPGMQAVLCTSLINTSGLFTDPLDYEIEGTDPEKPDYKVRAYATRRSTGKVLYGPWITWKLVRAEGWEKRSGSKWLTMPDQMFCYRAASWFANRHCPEVKMGMMTVEEAEEIPTSRQIESQVVEPGAEGLKKLLAEREQRQQTNGNGHTAQDPIAEQPEPSHNDPPDPAPTDEQDEQTAAKVQQQKERLAAAGAGTTQTGNGAKASNLFG